MESLTKQTQFLDSSAGLFNEVVVFNKVVFNHDHKNKESLGIFNNINAKENTLDNTDKMWSLSNSYFIPFERQKKKEDCFRNLTSSQLNIVFNIGLLTAYRNF